MCELLVLKKLDLDLEEGKGGSYGIFFYDYFFRLLSGTQWDATHFKLTTVDLSVCCESKNEPT